MHILFEENGYPRIDGWQGGAGTYVKIISSQLIENGHQVTVVMGEDIDCDSVSRVDNGIRVFPIKVRSRILWYISKIPLINIFFPMLEYLFRGFIKFKLILKINKEKKIDIIEYSEGGDFWQSIFKVIPYYCHIHGSGYTLKRHVSKIDFSDKILRAFQCFFISRAKLVISPSKKMIQLVEKENKNKFKNTISIKYPVNIIKKDKVLNKINHPNPIKIFMSARPDLTKGWITFLDAIKKVNTNYYKNVFFYLYGHEQIDPDYEIPNNVLVHPFIDRKRLLNKIEDYHIAVVPSYFDNSPNTIYEAMSQKIPVIGSNVGGIPELVIHRKTGLIFKNKSAVALGNAIIYFINNPEKIFEMGNNAYKMIFNQCNLKKNYFKRLQMWNN